jgi:hypothetical protein
VELWWSLNSEAIRCTLPIARKLKSEIFWLHCYDDIHAFRGDFMRRPGVSTLVAMACLVLVTGAKSQTTEPSGNPIGNEPAPATSVPRLIKFSGVLRDLDGQPLTGTVEVRFCIYKDQADAVAIWEEIQTLALDDQGHYTVLLGATQPEGLPPLLFASAESRWVGVSTAKLPEQPRVLLVSVPYALEAGDAVTLGGKPASAFLLAPSNQTSSGTTEGTETGATSTGAGDTRKQAASTAAASPAAANYIPVFTNHGALGSSVMYQAASNIGIGTTTPAGKLEVNGTTKFDGLVTFASGQTFPGMGTITGITTASGSGLTGGGTAGTLSLAVDSTVARTNGSNSFSGNQTVTGTLSASSFTGSGAGLTNVNATTLDGFAASTFQPAGSYATLGANTFSGNQSVSGTLSVAGHVTLEGVTSAGATGTGNLVFSSSPSLASPTLGNATATSLLANGTVDGEAPVTLTSVTSCTLGTASGCNSIAYNSGYTFNQSATPTAEVTYTLPTAAAGKQYCIANDTTGSTPDTGILRLNTSGSGQYIHYKGVIGASGGYIRSGGAAGDAGCVVGISSTVWVFYVQSGTWTQDSGG